MDPPVRLHRALLKRCGPLYHHGVHFTADYTARLNSVGRMIARLVVVKCTCCHRVRWATRGGTRITNRDVLALAQGTGVNLDSSVSLTLPKSCPENSVWSGRGRPGACSERSEGEGV